MRIREWAGWIHGADFIRSSCLASDDAFVRDRLVGVSGQGGRETAMRCGGDRKASPAVVKLILNFKLESEIAIVGAFPSVRPGPKPLLRGVAA